MLKNDGFISDVTVDALRKRAMHVCPSEDVLEKYTNGETYVEIEDEMKIKYDIGKDKHIKITF